MSAEIAAARALLAASGYVVLREKSYRAAQERQRLAEARKDWADDQARGTTKWAQNCLTEERRLRERLVFVYGIAMAHGATTAELAGSTGERAGT